MYQTTPALTQCSLIYSTLYTLHTTGEEQHRDGPQPQCGLSAEGLRAGAGRVRADTGEVSQSVSHRIYTRGDVYDVLALALVYTILRLENIITL